MKSFFRWVTAVLLVGYPLLVFWGLSRFSARALGGILLAAVVLRGFASGAFFHGAARDLLSAFLPLLFLIPVLCFGQKHFLLYFPALVSAALLFSFSRTLRRPPSMVERFARLQAPDLGNDEVLYCRKVTMVWCAFFVLNGAVALLLAWRGALGVWTIYNGFLSYILMGLLFTIEYLCRLRLFPHRAPPWLRRWIHASADAPRR